MTGMALHINSNSCLWSQVVLQLCHHDQAVKHALVAFGTAYHLYKSMEPSSAHDDQPHEVDKTKLFILAQYTASVSKLQEHIASGSPQSITIALVCCLVFTCLENLRGNYRGGVAHLKNGTRIIETTLDLHRLCDSTALKRPQPTGGGPNRTTLPFISDTELKGLVSYFRQAEICERLFSHDAPLLLASRLYSNSRLDDGTTTHPTEFTCLSTAYEARVKLMNDVMARDWKTRTQKGNQVFWSSPDVALEQQCLHDRAVLIGNRYEAFLARENSPKVGTSEYVSSCLDMLLVKFMRAIIAVMPLGSHEYETLMNTPSFAHDIIGGMIQFAEMVCEAMNSVSNAAESAEGFTIETGVVAPMYFAYVHSTISNYRARAFKILQSATLQEGPWAAKHVMRLLQITGASTSKSHESSKEYPGTQGRWADDLDCHSLFSAYKIRDSVDRSKSHVKRNKLKNGQCAERRRQKCF